MEYMLNDEFIPRMNDGTLNWYQARCLIAIKEFVDRTAANAYLDTATVRRLVDTYHAIPTVVTWGDYFQTEIGFQLLGQTDEEFRKALDTVKYDIISSHIIFSGKGIEFFEWVENNYEDYIHHKDSMSFREYEEIVHLKVLKDYYVNMGIVEKFTRDEMKWYNSYKEVAAV